MKQPYQAIDTLVLLAAVGEDRQLFRELSRIFLDTAPALLARIECTRNGAAPDFIHACHTLRGITALIGARALSALLLTLEQQARRGAMPDLPELEQAAQLFALACDDVRHSITGYPGTSA